MPYDAGISDLVLCDSLKGWEGSGRFKRERTNVYLGLLHVGVWLKPTHYCKAVILQLGKNSMWKPLGILALKSALNPQNLV